MLFWIFNDYWIFAGFLLTFEWLYWFFAEFLEIFYWSFIGLFPDILQTSAVPFIIKLLSPVHNVEQNVCNVHTRECKIQPTREILKQAHWEERSSKQMKER